MDLVTEGKHCAKGGLEGERELGSVRGVDAGLLSHHLVNCEVLIEVEIKS